MENRAAVFTSQPQSVEVYQSGAWWPGQLLGWRHEPDGTCQVWVRVVLGGVEESAWTDLTALRLPAPHLSVAPGAVAPGMPTAQEAPATRSMPMVQGATGDRDPFETAILPLVRDRSVAATRTDGAPRAGGRRRAPDTGPLAAVHAVAARAVAPAATAATGDGGARGRHRAPGDPGRHRAADTGLLPVVAATESGRTVAPVRTPRLEESLPAAPRDTWFASLDPEPELLTRPMRLGDLASHSRRPRLDGSLAGV